MQKTLAQYRPAEFKVNHFLYVIICADNNPKCFFVCEDGMQKSHPFESHELQNLINAFRSSDGSNIKLDLGSDFQWLVSGFILCNMQHPNIRPI